MAYEKQTWECGETISADKLNHMEDGIANSGGDAGYECTETRTTLTEESVTTSATMLGTVVRILSYSQEISADTIRVTFDGTEYECEKIASDTENVYGATYNESTGTMDWSEYPFSVVSIPYPDSGAENALFTETEGTYTIKIESHVTTVEVTPCFRNAVNKIVKEEIPSILVLSEGHLGTPTVGTVSSSTVHYSDCVAGTAEFGVFKIWKDFDKFQGQPIIVQSIESGDYVAQHVSTDNLCPSTKAEMEGGSLICLKEAITAIYISTADGSDTFAVLPPSAEFYTADR